ncbi:hypothetical protein QL285_080224 [Trifolium repens]|nr:hypothetical protein QL285_080224 [Trifolium repens]
MLEYYILCVLTITSKTSPKTPKNNTHLAQLESLDPLYSSIRLHTSYPITLKFQSSLLFSCLHIYLRCFSVLSLLDLHSN